VVDPPDPAVWDVRDMRAALAARDINMVYRLLRRVGFSQRQIAALVGQSQSEVSEIIAGRRVSGYDVLERICTGLGVPRGYMGLAYSDIGDVLNGGVEPEVSEDVKRRAYLAAVSGLLFGEIGLGRAILGETAPLAWNQLVAVTSTLLPTRIGRSDVAALRALTEQMRALGWAGHAGMPEVLSPVTQRADRLLKVAEGREANLRALCSAAAELHTLAGWCAYDLHLFDLGRSHCDRALRLASDAGDLPAMVSAVLHAAWGEPDHDDGLKLCQLALFRLGDAEPGLERQLRVESAWRYAQIDYPDQARRELVTVHGLASVTDSLDAAVLQEGLGSVELSLGRLDIADQYATKAAYAYGEKGRRRGGAAAWIRRATIHARAGEPDTERLVPQALEAVGVVPSARGRAKLIPLEEALAARKTSTFMDLARRVRQVRQGTSITSPDTPLSGSGH